MVNAIVGGSVVWIRFPSVTCKHTYRHTDSHTQAYTHFPPPYYASPIPQPPALTERDVALTIFVLLGNVNNKQAKKRKGRKRNQIQEERGMYEETRMMFWQSEKKNIRLSFKKVIECLIEYHKLRK